MMNESGVLGLSLCVGRGGDRERVEPALPSFFETVLGS